MFYNSHKFNIDISAWDVSAVTNIGNMFQHTKVFNQNIASWDISKLVNRDYDTNWVVGSFGSVFKNAAGRFNNLFLVPITQLLSAIVTYVYLLTSLYLLRSVLVLFYILHIYVIIIFFLRLLRQHLILKKK